jgi:hypothetical protein
VENFERKPNRVQQKVTNLDDDMAAATDRPRRCCKAAATCKDLPEEPRDSNELFSSRPREHNNAIENGLFLSAFCYQQVSASGKRLRDYREKPKPPRRHIARTSKNPSQPAETGGSNRRGRGPYAPDVLVLVLVPYRCQIETVTGRRRSVQLPSQLPTQTQTRRGPTKSGKSLEI